ncbi:MAG: rhodanese-like domain-containing protein [Bacilli bacterium]|nr:rhodanese-like domain-containing protein [Bacilli bacterium]
MKKILLLIFVIVLLVGCGNEKINGEALYKTIEGDLAFEFVSKSKAILIDVRTLEEYEKAHIEGAINIPYDEITKEKIKDITNSEIDNIIVYCQSGSRSKSAAIQIIEYGYTNVYDLGSINNWEKIEDAE